MLETQTEAPDFQLMDENNQVVSLSDFKGRIVVLYFYPKDATPGCTKQACAFKQAYDDYRRDDIVVVGISKDSPMSHKRFKEKYDLPFILLSDPEINVLQKYDVWKEKKLYGKTYMGITRSTYVIDKKGIIIKTFEKANPERNAQDILDYLKTVSN